MKIISLFILLLFVSCSYFLNHGMPITSGEKFHFQNMNKLEIGKSKKDWVRPLIGSPLIERSLTINGVSYEIDTYKYQFGTSNEMRERFLFLEYKNKVLNAYIYSSNFCNDSTYFNYDLIEHIKSGDTRDKILSLFGKPSGIILCPSRLAELELDCNYIYNYAFTSPISDFSDAEYSIKKIFIGFNKKDIVVDFLFLKE